MRLIKSANEMRLTIIVQRNALYLELFNEMRLIRIVQRNAVNSNCPTKCGQFELSNEMRF